MVYRQKVVRKLRTAAQMCVSIIDVAATINGKDENQAAEDLRRISTGRPEVKVICFDFKLPGRGQRETPVTDAKGIVEIIMLQTRQQHLVAIPRVR